MVSFFNTYFIMKFLIYYKNKTTLSTIQLNNIIMDEEKKIKTLFNQKSEYNDMTPLNTFFTCLWSGDKDEDWTMVEYLIEHGADPNSELTEYYLQNIDSPEMVTPLIIACDSENETLIKYLVEHGADINKAVPINEDNHRSHSFNDLTEIAPLTVASSCRNTSILKYLVEHGAFIESLGYIHLSNPRGPYTINEFEYTLGEFHSPLFIACDKEDFSLVKYLVEQGEYVNQRSLNQKHTPLTLASERSNEAIVKYLVDHGADVNVVLYNNRERIKPLTVARKNGNEAIINYLEANSANSDIYDIE